MAGLTFPFIGEARKKSLKTRFLAARTDGLSQPDQRHLCLRLWRFCGDDAAGQNAYAWPRLYAPRHPCRRLTLSRHVSAGLAALRRKAFSRHWPSTRSGFRCCRPVRAHRRHHPRARIGHAICAAIKEALEAKEAGQERVILFNLSGHGHFDMAAYEAYFSGKLEDYEYPAEAVAAAQHKMPQVV